MSARGDEVPGDGDDTITRPQPWRVPWWRSVGFWLGLWGLVFLVWITIDSFPNASSVSSRGWVRSRGYSAGQFGWRLMLDRGRLGYTSVDVHEAPHGTITFKSPMRFEHQKGVGLLKASPWGKEISVQELRSAPDKLSLQQTEWWFPFIFVVAGYGAVWLGSLILLRRWMKRRWIAAQGAGELGNCAE